MSLNKVILIGNVGKDPDVRYFDEQNLIANFPLATSERGYKLKNGTEVPERTEWHNIVVRREQAKFVENYVKKGSGLYIEGKIRSRSYEDANKITRYITEIYADRVEFFNFGGRRSNDSGNDSGMVNKPQDTTTIKNSEISQEPFMSDGIDDLPF